MSKNNGTAGSETPAVDLGTVLATLTKLAERVDRLEGALTDLITATPIDPKRAEKIHKFLKA